jgi:ABC-type dipeptide/oligopeptide/nickel transport system ATPase component
MAYSDYSEDSQDLDVGEMLSILIIGKSGSGKSYLTKSLMEKFAPKDMPIYVVNDRSRKPMFKSVDWDRVGELRDCALVAEDLISAKPSQFVKLQELLNYQSHHNRVSPIIAICHSLLRNNIYGLLPYFSFVYVSAVKSSIVSFKNLLNYYNFDKEEQGIYMTQFLSCNEQFSHFMLDVENRCLTLTRAEESVRNEDERRERMEQQRLIEEPARKQRAAQASAKKYLEKMRRNSDYAIILFDLIYPVLPESRFNDKDLTVTLLKRGNEEVISIIDYIYALVDESGEEPDYSIYQLHRYLRHKRNLHLPKTYVLNRKLWS